MKRTDSPQEKKVLLFFSGGVSAESRIALLSAGYVYPHIDRELFDVMPVFIGPDGQWYLLLPGQTENWARLSEPEFLQAIESDLGRVELLPAKDGLKLRVNLPGAETPAVEERRIDLIFPMMHGPSGEDGTIQGLAKFFGVPVVGSDMSGSLINMDKVLMKAVLEQRDIPCARYRSFCRPELGTDGLQDRDSRRPVQSYENLAAELFAQWQCEALYVKPARMGSSIGMFQVKRADDLGLAIHRALCYDDKLLLEEGFCALELELAVIEQGRHLKVSNPAQIHSNGEFYSYEQKYFPDRQEKALVTEAYQAHQAHREGEGAKAQNDLPSSVIERARDLAAQGFRALGACHYARVDLFYLQAEDRLLLNEINTIPGFTAHSMFPKLMEAEGWPMERLVPHLLQLALQSP
ncbi:D-alanine--D-alanine ligase [Candidatus Haliotispira prima]|uniref:D-alanine--D-alanine ligase n=1 Tax=Candidatus Haliotispira prima TaxID=3034016 RepID=A0ABY8MNM9_9SPIO|nr:D-alanine--D-alanine ligase [Candidatus Haliotispira prima]